MVRGTCALRHYAISTEKTYALWVGKFCRFIKSQGSAYSTSEERVTAFLTDMAGKDYSAVSQNQAFNAILFLYRDCLKIELKDINAVRAKRPSRIRFCPSVQEVAAMLREVQDFNGYPTRLLTHLLYGCGLRVSEPIALRLRDVDLANSRITIRDGKGGKDRFVSLPCCLSAPMGRQMSVAKMVWENDQTNQIPVQLPDRLDVKYPGYRFALSWAWLFPLRTVSKHPRTGQIVRWHCLDQTIQRAVRAASDRTNLRGVVTPHCLRHAYATHALDRGANVHDVQQAMGHAHLDTTMGYLHPQSSRVASPLEAIFQ